MSDFFRDYWFFIPLAAGVLIIVGLVKIRHARRTSGLRYLGAAVGLSVLGLGLYFVPFWVAAAQAETAEDYYQLGRMHKYNGFSQASATRWFERAAEAGHKEAQFETGLAYWQGWGVPKDDAQARTWLQKAADQDHAQARDLLKRDMRPNGPIY